MHKVINGVGVGAEPYLSGENLKIPQLSVCMNQQSTVLNMNLAGVVLLGNRFRETNERRGESD